MALFERFLTKSRNQHRGTSYFKRLLEVGQTFFGSLYRCVRTIWRHRWGGRMPFRSGAFCGFCCSYKVPKTHPPRQALGNQGKSSIDRCSEPCWLRLCLCLATELARGFRIRSRDSLSLCSRFLATLQLVEALVPALLAAASQLSAQMGKGLFVPFCTAVFAVLARIQVGAVKHFVLVHNSS